jgi:hypothetical protein
MEPESYYKLFRPHQFDMYRLGTGSVIKYMKFCVKDEIYTAVLLTHFPSFSVKCLSVNVFFQLVFN